VREEDVEASMRALVGRAPVDTMVDLGTGTGRVLELFASQATHLYGIDTSREMLAIARAKLEAPGFRHVQVRQADIYSTPFADGFANLITIHQVLHYLDDPQRAILEARRILKPGGRLLIVDFAPHGLEELREQHAHRRLGISTESLTGWLARAGLKLEQHDVLAPPWLKSRQGLTVSLWLACARGIEADGSAVPARAKDKV
jgi:ubiquinone/menaquinone biosynthesis C-methylase UbiE